LTLFTIPGVSQLLMVILVAQMKRVHRVVLNLRCLCNTNGLWQPKATNFWWGGSPSIRPEIQVQVPVW
jgi:hypothetical protein